MGKPVKAVSVLLLLLSCTFLALAATSQSSTLPMLPFLRDTAAVGIDAEGNVFTHTRALLTTRNAPIGFPPPPAMTSPPPPY